MREENRGERLLLASDTDCCVEDKGQVIPATSADAETSGNEEIKSQKPKDWVIRRKCCNC